MIWNIIAIGFWCFCIGFFIGRLFNKKFKHQKK